MIEIGHITDESMQSKLNIDEFGLFVEKPRTNADRIRAMSDEELADWLWIRCGCAYCLGFENRKCRLSRRDNACKEYWFEWLKQEVDT